MILFINKGILESILKIEEEKAQKLLDCYPYSFPVIKTPDNFSPVVIHLKDENDYRLDSEENRIMLKRGASYLIQICLPDKKDKFYYKDCLLIARQFLRAYPLIEETNNLFETLMQYGEEDVTVQ